jgi:hypothetical protein
MTGRAARCSFVFLFSMGASNRRFSIRENEPFYCLPPSAQCYLQKGLGRHNGQCPPPPLEKVQICCNEAYFWTQGLFAHIPRAGSASDPGTRSSYRNTTTPVGKKKTNTITGLRTVNSSLAIPMELLTLDEPPYFEE